MDCDGRCEAGWWQGGAGGGAAGKQVRSNGVGDEKEAEREEGASDGRVGMVCGVRTLYRKSRCALT